jgi:NADH-quinone oxidoreductase subunit N
MTLLAFAVLIVINRATGSDDLKAFDGLHKRSPFLAFAMLVAAASLAGVPLTAGFLGKLFVFLAAASAEQWVPLAIAVAGAAAGFYYYFKVVRSMYWNAPATDDAAALSISPLLKAVIIALAAGSILLGLYPEAILRLLR